MHVQKRQDRKVIRQEKTLATLVHFTSTNQMSFCPQRSIEPDTIKAFTFASLCRRLREQIRKKRIRLRRPRSTTVFHIPQTKVLTQTLGLLISTIHIHVTSHHEVLPVKRISDFAHLLAATAHSVHVRWQMRRDEKQFLLVHNASTSNRRNIALQSDSFHLQARATIQLYETSMALRSTNQLETFWHSDAKLRTRSFLQSQNVYTKTRNLSADAQHLLTQSPRQGRLCRQVLTRNVPREQPKHRHIFTNLACALPRNAAIGNRPRFRNNCHSGAQNTQKIQATLYTSELLLHLIFTSAICSRSQMTEAVYKRHPEVAQERRRTGIKRRHVIQHRSNAHGNHT